MTDAECVAFLRWALPRLRLRWRGFRRVRRQVCRRVQRRLRQLGLADLSAYRAHLLEHPGEWDALDACTRITISRFYRDRAVFESLAGAVLPELARGALARGERRLAAWSAGCGSGEEPYSLAIVWNCALAASHPELEIRIRATDASPAVLERARRACFGPGSLRDLPAEWRERAFQRCAGGHRLRERHREPVSFECEDIRQPRIAPASFDLILCRNLVFTYFEEDLQREVLARLVAALVPGGALVVGAHEQLPDDARGLKAWPGAPCVHRRALE